MASFVGTADKDTITPALISAGVVVDPPGANLEGDDDISAKAGDDLVEGDSGTDTASLGGGHDRFIWNPGDGDDTVEGDAGTDTLEFNGSDDAEQMTVQTQEEDGVIPVDATDAELTEGFRFFRNLGDITVDATGVEVIEVNALGGIDIIDASGQRDPAVALVADAGDGDDVTIGGEGDDEITGALGNDVAFGLNGHDRFIWNPGDGDDVFNGGDGTDTLEFNGADAAEQMTVTTLGNDGFRFFRDVGDITVDTLNVEQVEVNALGGDDVVDGSAQTRADVALQIQGGAGGDTMTGGAGADTFLFGAESGNGVVETDTIEGYSADEGDAVDLSGAGGFNASEVVSGDLQLTLNGGDDDLLLIANVTDPNDVTFLI